MRLDPFPIPGTPEWGSMNSRRAELIEKLIDETLTKEEESELAYLQTETMRTVEGE